MYRQRHRITAYDATRPKALAAAAALLTSLMLPLGEAFADNCLDRVEQMAAAYGTSTDPPSIPPGEMKKPDPPLRCGRSSSSSLSLRRRCGFCGSGKKKSNGSTPPN